MFNRFPVNFCLRIGYHSNQRGESFRVETVLQVASLVVFFVRARAIPVFLPTVYDVQ